MLAGSAVLFALVMVLFALAWLRPGFGSSVLATALGAAGRAVAASHRADPAGGLRAGGGRAAAAAAGHASRRASTCRPSAGAGASAIRDQGGSRPPKACCTCPPARRWTSWSAAATSSTRFWVPRLAGKIDVIPGRINSLRLQADTPGRYQGQCAEFCGLEHTQHALRWSSCMPAADFAAWLAGTASQGSDRAPTRTAPRPRAAPAPRAVGDLGQPAAAGAPGLGQPHGDRPAHDGDGLLSSSSSPGCWAC